MNTERIEVILGWKCTNACVFCVERGAMKKFSHLDIDVEDIKKLLISEKEKGAKHVTFLGGEPTIQLNFKESVRFAKSLGYMVSITSNGAGFISENFTEENIKFIDEIVISIHAHENSLSDKICLRENSFFRLEKAIKNIHKHHQGRFLKTNTVISKLNYKNLKEIVASLHTLNIKSMDFSFIYHNLSAISVINNLQYHLSLIPSLDDVEPYLKEALDHADLIGMQVRVNDAPFCYLGGHFSKNASLYYTNRVKISEDGVRHDRRFESPRETRKIKGCAACKFQGLCNGFIEIYLKAFPEQKVKPLV